MEERGSHQWLSTSQTLIESLFTDKMVAKKYCFFKTIRTTEQVFQHTQACILLDSTKFSSRATSFWPLPFPSLKSPRISGDKKDRKQRRGYSKATVLITCLTPQFKKATTSFVLPPLDFSRACRKLLRPSFLGEGCSGPPYSIIHLCRGRETWTCTKLPSTESVQPKRGRKTQAYMRSIIKFWDKEKVT